MKILILSNIAEGLYLFRKELLLELRKKGHYVVASVPRGEYFDEISSMVDEVLDTSLDRRGMNPFRDLKLVMAYFQILRQVKPDCVLTYTIKPNLYGGIVSQICGVPYLLNITGLGSTFFKDTYLRKILILLYKISVKGSDGVFFQNQYNKCMLDNFNIQGRNAILLPGSGVNLEYNNFETYPQKTEPLKFLFVARVMRDKGINELIEAIRILKKKYSTLEFHIVGWCEEGYEKCIQSWVEEELIIYHGPQKNVHTYMKCCHCLIHPSYHEGLSNVCLEAAATGRPILASDIPGCRETFDNGESGLSFQPQHVESLVNTIERFIRLPYDKKVNMGKKGRKKIEEQFSRQLVVDAYMKEINKIEGE